MSYRLAKFGMVDLPCARMTGTYGTGPTVDATVQVIGGTFGCLRHDGRQFADAI